MENNIWTDLQKEGIQSTEVGVNETIPQPASVIPDEQYKALQAEYTTNRQELIETTSALVEAKPSYLHTIKDSKLKDSVSKKLFDMGYNEAVAIFGKDFSSTTADEAKNKEAFENSIEKEVRLLKYRAEQNEILSEIASHKVTSPNLFENTNMEEKILEELANISSSLPIKERVSRAITLAWGNAFDSKSLAYQILNKGKVNSGSSTQNTKEKTEVEIKTSALSDYINKRMGVKK